MALDKALGDFLCSADLCGSQGLCANAGVITNQLTRGLQRNPNFKLQVQHEVTALRQDGDKIWNVTVKDLKSGTERTVKSRFVFIGAGGAALKLLQLSGVPEARSYAGFPVGGQFLAFKAPAVAERHKVKVYGMAETGSPPMSVPHIDSRKLDDKPVVLFGPFALFSTKFLKEGSWFDLLSSVNSDNVAGMLKVGSENLDLVKYLPQQAELSDDDRHAELLKYYPNAKREDWELITAGQRVQIIKKDPEKGPILQVGTEIVTDKDKTIAALLGASPGASTAPPIMLNLLAQAFPKEMDAGWKEKLKNIVPSYGRKINDSAELTNEIRAMTGQALQLPYLEVPVGSQGAAADKAQAAPTPIAPTQQPRNANTEMQAL